MNEIPQNFLAMNVDERQRFLTAYAHELTVLARMHFADSEWEPARECNESLHRILGYLLSAMRDQDAYKNRSFIEMIVKGAHARGWSHILQRTLQSMTRWDARE
jgi:hypothetical protein